MKRLISIGGGEPEYKTPEHIIDAMKEAMDEGHTHYGNFRHIPELREAVAAKYRRLGVDADPEHVLITPGSTMGIYMVFNGLMEPGDDLLTFDPCFFGYFHSQRLLGFNPVPVPRYEDENWRFHVEDLYEAATPRTKALLICSPEISDDIYDEITYDGARFRSIASLPGMRERTVILNGLSKAYAMTGWRVGYAIAPDEELYKKFFEVQMSTFLVVNAAVQHASVAALTGPQDCVREMVAEYDEKRRFVLDAYGEIPGVTVTRPEGAFYLFPDMSSYGLSSPKMAEYLREEARVAITPGLLFGSNGEGHIRNAFCQSMGDLSEGMERIKTALAKL
jgi:aspartate/methionine/tyrosine aminotransferase